MSVMKSVRGRRLLPTIGYLLIVRRLLLLPKAIMEQAHSKNSVAARITRCVKKMEGVG